MKFKSDIEVQAGLKDSSGSAGTSGQILSSTASGVSWINQISLSGYVPYTGATTNVDLGTHTLLAKDLAINHSSGSGVAASITKGGSGEALTINKTSGSGNAMSVTGGLTSLVDLALSSIANATIDTDRFIVSDSGLIKYRTGAQVLSDIGGQAALTNPITGTGTLNYVSKFTGSTSLGNSQIFDNGTNVGIGTTIPDSRLSVIQDSGVIAQFNTNFTSAGNVAIELGSYSTVYPNSGTHIRAYFNHGSTLASDLAFEVNGEQEKMRITSAGNVGIGTSSPSALLDVAGDALINGVTVGRGPGNDDTNTVVGNGTFSANISAQNNTIIGKWAGIGKQYGNGNIIIGANNYNSPDGAIVDYSNTISISRGSNIVAGGPPHIWAPSDVYTSSTVDVITVNYTTYRAMFVEYVIEDESGNIRGGYIKGIWNNDATIIKMTEETTSSIGVTTDYVFDLVDNGSSIAALQLTSTSGDPVYCSVTSRLLTRPY